MKKISNINKNIYIHIILKTRNPDKIIQNTTNFLINISRIQYQQQISLYSKFGGVA